MKTDERIILLVEDNDDDVELALRAFKKSGLRTRIIVARDGEEALDYLYARGSHSGRSSSETPQLILLDINLPTMNGLEVLRQIRAHQPTRRVPTVVLTSSKEAGDIASSYDFGANSYVRKPVDFNRFVGVAEQLVRYWLTVNEAPLRT